MFSRLDFVFEWWIREVNIAATRITLPSPDYILVPASLRNQNQIIVGVSKRKLKARNINEEKRERRNVTKSLFLEQIECKVNQDIHTH